MAREKKDGKFVNIYMDAKIFKALSDFCDKYGQTKTTAIERAIIKYIEGMDKDADKDRIQ